MSNAWCKVAVEYNCVLPSEKRITASDAGAGPWDALGNREAGRDAEQEREDGRRTGMRLRKRELVVEGR
jgi:hypothetical protein